MYFQPHSNDRVVARSTTDSEGRFEFKDVAPGSWCIGPAAVWRSRQGTSPADVAPVGERIDVPAAASRDVVLHLYRGIYIRGVIVDSKGAAVLHGSVSGGPEPDHYGVNADADNDGKFVLGPLASGTLTLQGFSPTHAPSELVKAQAGAHDVVLRVRAGGALRGHVVDSQTTAPATGEIIITPAHPGTGPWDQGMSTSTEPDGRFEIEGLQPDQYGIVVRTPDGRFGVVMDADVVAERESEDLSVPVSTGGTLRLRYDGAKQRLTVRVKTRGLPIGWPDSLEPGKTLEKHAPQGALVIELLGNELSVKRSINVDLAAGEVKEVVIHDE
jgi:hypothetical protein